MYETDSEQTFKTLDVIRLAFLLLISCAYIVEAILDSCSDRFTVARFMRIVACLVCLGLFLTEAFYIAKQTPTREVLAKSKDVIDFRALVSNFKMLYYVQAVNLILLVCFLIPFFQFLTQIQSTLNVITNIGSLILLFGCLWWAFAILFAYVISNTWGYQLKGFRNIQSAVL